MDDIVGKTITVSVQVDNRQIVIDTVVSGVLSGDAACDLFCGSFCL